MIHNLISMMVVCVFSVDVDVNRQEQSGIKAGTGTDIGPLVQPLVTWYFKMMVSETLSHFYHMLQNLRRHLELINRDWYQI